MKPNRKATQDLGNMTPVVSCKHQAERENQGRNRVKILYIFMLGKQTTSARHDSPNFFKFLQKEKTLTVCREASNLSIVGPKIVLPPGKLT